MHFCGNVEIHFVLNGNIVKRSGRDTELHHFIKHMYSILLQTFEQCLDNVCGFYSYNIKATGVKRVSWDTCRLRRGIKNELFLFHGANVNSNEIHLLPFLFAFLTDINS